MTQLDRRPESLQLQGFRAMELTGALSNPETAKAFGRLNTLRERLLAEPPKPRKRLRMRPGVLPNAIREVMEVSDSPMTTAEVYTQVERLLSMCVPRHTVNSILSAGACDPAGPYEKVSHGVYRFSA